MSLMEPRCMVCGAPLDKGAPFENTVRKSEVCSDLCYRLYMDMPEDEDEDHLRKIGFEGTPEEYVAKGKRR